jgi:uncharacterized protein YcfJ
VNNNTILAGIIVGGVVLAAAGAIAYNSGYNPLQKYATVVAVTPAYDSTQTPRVVCGDEATLAQAQAQAAAGSTPQADPGKDFQSSPPPPPASPRAEVAAAPESGKKAIPRCLTVYETASVEAGFDVTYEVDGVQKVVRMDREPGRRIPVEDGELVLSQS